MPELPEAETIVRDLDRRVRGARIAGAHVVHPDVLGSGLTAKAVDRRIRGRRIERVFRRGKNVIFILGPAATPSEVGRSDRDGDDVRARRATRSAAGHAADPAPDAAAWLMINLGMTGRVVASDAKRAAELRHVAVRFDFDDGRALLYDDARRFGRIDLLGTEAWSRRDTELGVEPLGSDFNGARLFTRTRRSKVPIRNWLLDQTRVAGVGNIYANEALFRARVRPTRRAYRLTKAEADRLVAGLRDVLEEAIEARGTTFSDYRDADGEAGAFEPRLRVYGRQGLPCPVCGAPIKRVVLTNRSAFYCPRDQR